jgi:hypothetical protein
VFLKLLVFRVEDIDMNKSNYFFVLIPLILIVVSCSSEPFSIPIFTQEPSRTFTLTPEPSPTKTPQPSETPTQTHTTTNTPTETNTPTPFDTPTPSNTPSGGGTGMIIYRIGKFGKPTRNSEIYTINSHGTVNEWLFSGNIWGIQSSADGTILGYAHKYLESQLICRFDLIQKDKKCNTFCSEFILSPSGNQYYCPNEGVVRDFSFAHKITNLRIKGTKGVAWSRDGEKILLQDEEGLYLVDIQSRDKVLIKKGYRCCVDWSFDETKIAYYKWERSKGDIYVMNSDGINEQRITNHEQYYGYGGKWSPIDMNFAYQFPRSIQSCRTWLNIINVSTGRIKGVKSRNICDFSWSPDGTLIAFIADPDQDGDLGIYITDLSNSEPTLLLDDLDADYASIDW